MDDITEIIIRSMIQLLNRKRFEDITVINICRESSVGRSTFYRYFQDKYDLTRQVLRYLILLKNSPSQENEHFGDRIYQILERIEKNSSLFLNILNYKGPDSFEETLFESIEEFLMEVFLYSSGQNSEFKYNAAGITQLVIGWINSGFKQPIEELEIDIENSVSLNKLKNPSYLKGSYRIRKKSDLTVISNMEFTPQQSEVLDVFKEFLRTLITRDEKRMREVLHPSMTYSFLDGTSGKIDDFIRDFNSKRYLFHTICLKDPKVSIKGDEAEISMKNLLLFGEINHDIGVFEDLRNFVFIRDQDSKWKLVYSYNIF